MCGGVLGKIFGVPKPPDNSAAIAAQREQAEAARLAEQANIAAEKERNRKRAASGIASRRGSSGAGTPGIGMFNPTAGGGLRSFFSAIGGGR